jgi:SAM-dependent methyltransferase
MGGTGRPAWWPHGSGPGALTPDGCAVEFYAALPPAGEPEIVHAAIPQGASILELGAGAGRMTHRLIELGHPVVAVDESPEMLERIRGAETVCSSIQTISLDRRFAAVLLASHLVNVPDDAVRHALLATCRRHVRHDGCVILQRQDPKWFDTAAPYRRTKGPITFHLRDVDRPAPGLITATMAYQIGEQRWTQTFTAQRLDDGALAAALADVGLAVQEYLADDRTWIRAVPLNTTAASTVRCDRPARRLACDPW